MNINSELSQEIKDAIRAANKHFALHIETALQEQFAADGVPDTLCHYTDFRGLKGILETGAFWATHARVLNDDSEIEYGLNIVRDHVRRFPDSVAASRLLGRIEEEPQTPFVSCFCESSSVLSMWIAYAKRGGGYCLEFSAADGLLPASYPPFDPKMAVKMSYGETLPNAAKKLLDLACGFSQRGEVETLAASSWLRILALRFKHPAFAQEREWRIIVSNPPVSTMNFRAGEADVKPYIELRPVTQDGSCMLPLKRVIFGPTLRQDKVIIETIRLMLARYGYADVPVEPSGLPFRQ